MDKNLCQRNGVLWISWCFFPEENKLGQRFKVDLTVELSLKEAGITDDLSHSVNYGELYNTCKNVVEGKPYQLIEAVAENIAADIFETVSAYKAMHCQDY
ncbi:hypothetical protein GCM10020331_018430 [Ectobacillus funiculus]